MARPDSQGRIAEVLPKIPRGVVFLALGAIAACSSGGASGTHQLVRYTCCYSIDGGPVGLHFWKPGENVVVRWKAVPTTVGGAGGTGATGGVTLQVELLGPFIPNPNDPVIKLDLPLAAKAPSVRVDSRVARPIASTLSLPADLPEPWYYHLQSQAVYDDGHHADFFDPVLVSISGRLPVYPPPRPLSPPSPGP